MRVTRYCMLSGKFVHPICAPLCRPLLPDCLGSVGEDNKFILKFKLATVVGHPWQHSTPAFAPPWPLHSHSPVGTYNRSLLTSADCSMLHPLPPVPKDLSSTITMHQYATSSRLRLVFIKQLYPDCSCYDGYSLAVLMSDVRMDMVHARLQIARS